MAAILHATAIAIDGHGVLIVGPSGCGKSDLALRLIDRGARLVADDRVEARAADGGLWLSAPPMIAGLIEMRGVGLVAATVIGCARALLVCRLDAPVERLPLPATVEVAGVALPSLALAPFEASAPLKLERAVALAAVGRLWAHDGH